MTNKPTPPQEGPQSQSRRNFLAAVGASVASLNAAACIRKPMERILPYGQRPEDLIPGEPEYYSTAFSIGGAVEGLLACSTDGRPTKIEGNPKHPSSQGATTTWAQASVLTLYDPERSRNAYAGKTIKTPDEVDTELAELGKSVLSARGEGFAVLVDATPSPTFERLLSELTERAPKTRVYRSDPADDENALAGAAMVGVEGMSWTCAGRPRVIAALDADPLGTEGDVVRFTKMFAAGRDVDVPEDRATRLYVAEPQLTLTGANADHRLPLAGAKVAGVLASVANQLRKSGLAVPAVDVPEESADSAWAKALAEDLASRPRGETLVVVGERQPPQVHALALVINAALGNLGKTLVFAKRDRASAGDLRALAEAVSSDSIKKLLILGGNPVYDAPGDLPMADVIGRLENVVHVGAYRDETGVLAQLHIPKSHYLEAWGDLVARDGTVSVQQPLIAPLYESLSAIEVLARVLGEKAKGYDLVRATLEPMGGDAFDTTWQSWLHDGVAARMPTATPSVNPGRLETAWTAGPVEEGFELDFVRDASVFDGRFGNSPWLQELPDPITKLTWDNAALVAPETAKKLGAETGTIIEVRHHEEKLSIPIWIQPGTAPDVIVLPIGYGRERGGKYAKSGFSVSGLRLHAAPYVLTGAVAKATSRSYALASTQVETSLHGRPHIRGTTRTDFTEDENFVEKFEVMDAEHVRTLLWEEPWGEVDHKWGMTIDLNSCTGCSACTVACQAENNIPWVGKEEVLKGRELHWIRIDRYFEPKGEDVEVKIQPMACVHCETAPCENVCPVAATVHSPEGTNDMIYNRCIGTRYCSNNCPYKVRRFNFFHYTVRNDAEYGMGIAMQRNPNVTVRYRGVMEKCSYCMQRINKARIDAKVHRDGIIRDGEVTPACAQACPADAITFGNLADEKSRVAKKAEDPRNYSVLAEINTRPRTTYLARLTNPNPKLTTNG